ncbi:hypothetical protein [Winogradskyella tangerina]|uniref:hypothetical protein n=1 Tax=Winogradskyella tangerina TaxID=2023240 RepID=UPI0013002D8D|nr:hypothetical protein [Winogradskyella tangerina]
MRNNIAGGLVIFMVVLTCLLMLDDISNEKDQVVIKETADIEQIENQKDLAIVENEE